MATYSLQLSIGSLFLNSTKNIPLFLCQVNQIGSVTESIEAVKMSKQAGWGVMASHRRYDILDVSIKLWSNIHSH